MADLAASAVTINDSWYPGQAKQLIARECTIVLAAMGTIANGIPASAFGLSAFVGPVTLTKSDDTEIVLGTPSYDLTQLILAPQVTDIADVPLDYTGTYRGVITGRV